MSNLVSADTIPNINEWPPGAVQPILERMIQWKVFDIRVVVKISSGRAIDIYINRNELIIDLKKKFANVEQIPPNQQQLIHQGKRLDNDYTPIAATGIKNNSVVHCFFRLSGGAKRIRKIRRRSKRLAQKRLAAFLCKKVKTEQIQWLLQRFLHGTNPVDAVLQMESRQVTYPARTATGRSRSRSRSRSPS